MEEWSRSEDRVWWNIILKMVTVKYTPSSSIRSIMCQKNQFSLSSHNSGINNMRTTIQNLMEHGDPPSPSTASSIGTKRGKSVPYLGTQAPSLDAYALIQALTLIVFLYQKLKKTWAVKTQNICALMLHYFLTAEIMEMQTHWGTLTSGIDTMIHPPTIRNIIPF